MKCPSCGASAPAGSRFCPVCGKSMDGSTRASPLPWMVAGAMLATLAAVLLVRQTASSRSSPAAVPAASAPASDISQMSPRERADRLFNRVMSASERGDTGEIRFFAPMAVQAYDMIGALDADARYHVGMIQLALGATREAAAQADSLAAAHPGHLLASLLRAEVAERTGDAPARSRAWRDLLRNYEKEMATGRAEYDDHRTALEAAREEARKSAAG